MAYLKKDAPPDVLETLRQAEAQADECWRTLQILDSPANVAIWALLTGGIQIVEREQAARGSNTPYFDAMLGNVSRSLAVAVKWAIRHGQPVAAPLNRRWTGELAATVDQAISIATHYSHFEVCFQAFHKDRYEADVMAPALVRFTAPGTERDRQVSAYQKGLRPREGQFALQHPEQQPQGPRVREAFDFLCFRWGQVAGAYPVESAVMVRAASSWVDVLSDLSGIAREKCQVMLADLTFSNRSVDLHVYPLVALDGANEVLALAPPFPLHSRHDENILRVCSQRRPQVYDVTSLEKEAEMRDALRAAGARYGADGPLTLPGPLPDIDLVLADEASATLVIAELKWLRKTLRPAEIPERDAELLKGIDQLSRIQRFLAGAPDYLSAQGRLPRPVNQYGHVHYLLVARDHWRWVKACPR